MDGNIIFNFYKRYIRCALLPGICVLWIACLSIHPACALSKEFQAEEVGGIEAKTAYVGGLTDSGILYGYHFRDEGNDIFQRRQDGTIITYEWDDAYEVNYFKVSNSGRAAIISRDFDALSHYAEGRYVKISLYSEDGAFVKSYLISELIDTNTYLYQYRDAGFDAQNNFYMWGAALNGDGQIDVVFREDGDSLLVEELSASVVYGIDVEGNLILVKYSDYTGRLALKKHADNQSFPITDEPYYLSHDNYDLELKFGNSNFLYSMNSSGEFFAYNPDTRAYYLAARTGDSDYEFQQIRLRRSHSKRWKNLRENRQFIPRSAGASYVLGTVTTKVATPALQDRANLKSLRHRKLVNRITEKPANCRFTWAEAINAGDQFASWANCRGKGGKVTEKLFLISPSINNQS